MNFLAVATHALLEGGAANTKDKKTMKPKTIEELETALALAEEKNVRLAESYTEEFRVIKLLVAAGIVTDEKLAAARELVEGLK